MRVAPSRPPLAPRLLMCLSAACALVACSDDEPGRAPDGGREAGSPDAPAPLGDAAPDRAVPHDANDGDAAVIEPEDSGSADAMEAGVIPKALLRDTGLYADFATETLAPGVEPYTVRFELWADTATKRRFLYLPPGSQIDTSDMDGWVFPVGTKLWKEFTRGGERVETRLLEKKAEGPSGWTFVAFAWNAAQTEATAVPDGLPAALGTEHDVPDQAACFGCHSGAADFVLGVSAIQLAHDGDGVTLAGLASGGRRREAPATTALDVPGDETAQRALGTLHANCAHCHRPGTLAWERAEMDLRLTTDALGAVTDTLAYQTTVGITTERIFEDADVRIAPGDALHSAVYVRMNSRDAVLAMPPLASKDVDTDGAAAVFDWIEDLGG